MYRDIAVYHMVVLIPKAIAIERKEGHARQLYLSFLYICEKSYSAIAYSICKFHVVKL